MDQLRPLKHRASMPSFPRPRRYNTVPTSFQPEASRAAEEPAGNGSVETLYSHPSVRIIAFTAGKSAFDRPGQGQEDKPGTLPSSSQFERSIAVGAFQIYRAPGSVAFLRSGTALQPILPKSQAWCLDEQSSKFVLQIRRPNYWRIEVPVGNDEESRTAHMLREVLGKILQLEKTPCPFERSFTVELPETPQTAIKKRTWTPPARTVFMNWPPGAPVTPPPEFASRTRFYTPGARRNSDFGVDMSRMDLTPAASPQMAEQAREGVDKPMRSSGARRDLSLNMCGRLLEEPEPLSPPPTAIPMSIAKITEELKTGGQFMTERLQKPTEPSPVSVPVETGMKELASRKREPIWVTRKPLDPAQTTITQQPAVPQTQTGNAATPAPIRPAEAMMGSSPASSDQDSPAELDILGDSSQSIHGPARDITGELEAIEGALEGTGQLRVRRTRVAAFASRRAATAPALRLRTPSASMISSVVSSIKETTPEPEDVAELHSPAQSYAASSAESVESFYSLESWHEPLSPPAASLRFSPSQTYPFPHENIPLAFNNGQASGSTTAPTVSGWNRNMSGAVMENGYLAPETPFTDVDENVRSPQTAEGGAEPEPVEPIATPEEESSSDSISTSWSSAASYTSNNPIRRHVSTTSVAISHRSLHGLSSLTPAHTLLNTSSHNNSSSRTTAAARAIRRIPSSIFNKTCEILISPPAHLISLMLKVAARISAGEWRGFVYELGEGGELVDVRWDWSDYDHNGGGGGAWEDDFGFANAHRRRASPRGGASAGGTAAGAAAAAIRRPRRKAIEYQDPWATSPEEPDEDENGRWSGSWGVD